MATSPRFTSELLGAGFSGRRPQMCPSWMGREEFEVCRGDPYRAFDAANTRIAELQQRVAVSKKMNAALLQDPQYQFGQAVQGFEKLRKDHIQLNDQYNDLEAVNETLQEVLEVVRGDKHQLLVEINAVKREVTIQGIENEQIEAKTKAIAAANEGLDLKLKGQESQLANLDAELAASRQQLTQLRSEAQVLEESCQSISQQSASLSDLRQHLESTRVAQDRAIQSLEAEVQCKVHEVQQHDGQLWEFKRDMSGRVLALQKKAQEAQDELSRLQRLAAHEIATLAAQNSALNDELKATADTLFVTRKEKADFGAAAKKEIGLLREEMQQATSVIDLIERQNQGLEASIARMVEQVRLSEKQIAEKDTINHKNLIEQANFLSVLHMELQTTREDLFILKARLCGHCRDDILGADAEEDRRLLAAKTTGAQQQPAITANGASKAGALVSLSSGNNPTDPLHFDPATGALSAESAGEGNAQLQAELKAAREALTAVNAQLLEERRVRDRERNTEEETRRTELTERAAQQVEEEARRRRAEEDQRKAGAGEEPRTLTVRLVDGSRKKVECFLSDTVGLVCERLATKLGIRHTEMFHLAHAVNENSALGAVERYLDRGSTLDQEGITTKANLVFKVKHHKRHRAWGDTVAQDWYFRQLHAAVVQEYFPTPERLAVELASFELQAVFGDAAGKKRHAYFDRVGLDSYLPMSVSAHDYEYWQDRLYKRHVEHRGMTTVEARSRYMESLAGKSPYWGITFFDIRDRDNRPFLAGVAEDGLHIFTANRKERIDSFRFDQLLGWQRTPTATGVSVKKRGSSKMTVYACSRLQSKEMVDLLDEYYMLLPQELREVFGVVIADAARIRAALPPPGQFDAVASRQKPVEFSSPLEYLKAAYLEHCLKQGAQQQPLAKFTKAMDAAMDADKALDTVDLGGPETDNWQLAVVFDLMKFVVDQVAARDTESWRDDINVRCLSVGCGRSEQRLTDACVPNLCGLMLLCPMLTSVNLSHVPLGNKNESDVANALVKLPRLESLVLKGCAIGPHGFDHIVRVFAAVLPSPLKLLDVGHNELTHESAARLASIIEGDNCSLEHLSVEENRIDATGIDKLIVAIRRQTTTLTSLDIGGNPGGVGAGRRFADLVAPRAGIKTLSLAHSGLTGDDGALMVATELKGKGAVRKISLASNPIGPTLTRQRVAGGGEVGRDYPAEFFAFLDVASNSLIESLTLDRCELHEDAGQALAAALHNNGRLTELSLANNPLAPQQTGLLPAAWTDMLAANRALRRLDLSQSRIAYRGAMELFAALARNRGIATLVLDGNALDRYPTQTPHAELVECLGANATLAELSLRDCFIRDDLLLAVGEGLRRNRALRRLFMSGNELTVRGVMDLARLLADNGTLDHLDLACRSVQANDELYLQAYRQLVENSNVDTVVL